MRLSERLENEAARSCLIKHAKKMEATLSEIRELLDTQENRWCLGTGYPKHYMECAPWSKLDEAVNTITVALDFYQFYFESEE